jgi:chemotaxis protein CheC
LGASGREVLGEVGNILLNACLGVFGNLLKIRLGFTVPRLNIDDLGSFLRSIIIDEGELKYALIVGARFRIRVSEVAGCLVLVLGVASLNLLTDAIEQWATAAVSGAAEPSSGNAEIIPERGQ